MQVEDIFYSTIYRDFGLDITDKKIASKIDRFLSRNMQEINKRIRRSYLQQQKAQLRPKQIPPLPIKKKKKVSKTYAHHNFDTSLTFLEEITEDSAPVKPWKRFLVHKETDREKEQAQKKQESRIITSQTATYCRNFCRDAVKKIVKDSRQEDTLSEQFVMQELRRSYSRMTKGVSSLYRHIYLQHLHDYLQKELKNDFKTFSPKRRLEYRPSFTILQSIIGASLLDILIVVIIVHFSTLLPHEPVYYLGTDDFFLGVFLVFYVIILIFVFIVAGVFHIELALRLEERLQKNDDQKKIPPKNLDPLFP